MNGFRKNINTKSTPTQTTTPDLRHLNSTLRRPTQPRASTNHTTDNHNNNTPTNNISQCQQQSTNNGGSITSSSEAIPLDMRAAFREFMKDFKNHTVNVTYQKQMRLAAAIWQALTPEQKQPYVDAAKNAPKKTPSTTTTALKRKRASSPDSRPSKRSRMNADSEVENEPMDTASACGGKNKKKGGGMAKGTSKKRSKSSARSRSKPRSKPRSKLRARSKAKARGKGCVRTKSTVKRFSNAKKFYRQRKSLKAFKSLQSRRQQRMKKGRKALRSRPRAFGKAKGCRRVAVKGRLARRGVPKRKAKMTGSLARRRKNVKRRPIMQSNLRRKLAKRALKKKRKC